MGNGGQKEEVSCLWSHSQHKQQSWDLSTGTGSAVAPAAHSLSSLLPLSRGLGHTSNENKEVHSCACRRFRVTEDSLCGPGEQGRGKSIWRSLWQEAGMSKKQEIFMLEAVGVRCGGRLLGSEPRGHCVVLSKEYRHGAREWLALQEQGPNSSLPDPHEKSGCAGARLQCQKYEGKTGGLLGLTGQAGRSTPDQRWMVFLSKEFHGHLLFSTLMHMNIHIHIYTNATK